MDKRFNKTVIPLILLCAAVFFSCGDGLDVLMDSTSRKITPFLGSGNPVMINNSPIITGFTADLVNPHPGQSVNLTVDAADPDGDPLNYAYAFTAGSGTIGGSGASTTATVDNMGNNTITVTVTDGKGGQATQTLDLTGWNNAPFITVKASAGTIWNNGTDSKTFTVTASDADGDPLTFSYGMVPGGTAAGCAVSGDTATNGKFTSGTSGGISTVRVTVSDGWNQATSYVQVKVCGWRQLQPISGPTARFGHCAINDGSGNMIVFGGFSSGTYQNDVWQYNIESQTWTPLTSVSAPPSGRYWFGAVYDGSDNMIIYGGNTAGGYVHDVWKYTLSTQTWADVTPVSGSPPNNRASMSSIYDGAGGMVIFSGSSSYATDVWRYNITTKAWVKLNSLNNTPPSGPVTDSFHYRSANVAVYDGTNMIIFGGAGNSITYYNDVWKYDFSIPSPGSPWTDITPGTGSSAPTARASANAIYDGNGNMIVFGGAQGNSSNLANDVWQFNIAGETWTELFSKNAPNHPSARYYHSAIYYYDGTSGTMIIFGGSTGVPQNDVWMYVLP